MGLVGKHFKHGLIALTIVWIKRLTQVRHERIFLKKTVQLRRSILTVPAINQRALEKVHTLDCDGVIFDLEDSVAAGKKQEARQNLLKFFEKTPLKGREAIIRINSLTSDDGKMDLAFALACEPDVILLPKVEAASDIHDIADLLYEEDAPEDINIWAMIETPKGVLNVAAIAQAAQMAETRLSAFVVGLNDLRKETRVPAMAGRQYLVPWMMQVILAARAYGLDVIDSVSNEFHALDVYAQECEQGRAMGFDGKMLIHPAQIEAANHAFAPTFEEIEDAKSILAVFADKHNKDLNVVNMNGKMIERLHADHSSRIVAFSNAIVQREAKKK